MVSHKQELPMATMEILYRLSGFRGTDFFLEINQPETIIAHIYMVAMYVNGSERNEQS